MTNPNDALQSIVNISDDKKGKADVIIKGYKIANAALREFVDVNKYTKKLSDHDILELIMALDELVETQEVDNEKLKDIQEDPNILLNK